MLPKPIVIYPYPYWRGDPFIGWLNVPYLLTNVAELTNNTPPLLSTRVPEIVPESVPEYIVGSILVV
jgi:hypothetical protein